MGSMNARDGQAASLVLGRDPTGAVAHDLVWNICRGANQQYRWLASFFSSIWLVKSW